MNPALAKSSNLVRKKYYELFFPTVLGALAGQLGLFIDSLIVGNFINSYAMTGVSVCLPLTQTVASVSILLSVGASGMIAVAAGARRNKEGDRIFSIVVILNIFVSLSITLLLFPFLKELTGILTKEPVIAGQTYEYLRIIIFGIPFSILLLSLSTIIRSDGLAGLSSQGIIISQCVNLTVDLILIGALGMDIRGAAVATVTGDAAGVIWMIVRYAYKEERTLHLISHIGNIKEFFGIAKELLSRGGPIAAGMWLVSVKVWCIYRILAANGGEDAMTVYSVCMYVLTLLSLVAEGCNGALLPILGILYGEKDYQGVRMLVRYDLKFILSIAGVLVTILIIAPQSVLMLYNLPPELVKSSGNSVRLFSISLLGQAAIFQLMLYYSTIGKGKAGNLLAVTEGFLAVVPVAWILVRLIGSIGVWISFIIAELAGFMVLFIYIKISGAHSGDKYIDIFMIPETLPELLYDVSLKATVENAVLLSADSIEALKQGGVSEDIANKAGVALEEMTVNIASRTVNDKPVDIDVRITRNNETVVLSLRDNGLPFDPLEYTFDESEEYRTDGIFLLKAIARNVTYSRALSLNQTTIEI